LVKAKRYAEAAWFARSYIPQKLDEIMDLWIKMLQNNDLPFLPEDLFKAPGFSEEMQRSSQLFEQKLKNGLYS
jgi:hypothetical protein